MKQKNADKIKLIKLLEILRQDSDEDHPLSTNNLINKLLEQGIYCRRETLYKDIQVLNEYGYEIICNKNGMKNEYFIEDRSFSLPELRVLIDSIEAASFLTKKKSQELIDKVSDLGGSHRAELLKNDCKFYNITKHTNEYVYYNINEIEHAINQNKKLSFKYFDYDDKLDKVFRKDGKRYYINPYSMIINQDQYYLIGYNDLYKKVLHFRIDRMTEVKISHLEIVNCDFMNSFDVNIYAHQLFGMYGGDLKSITIKFDKELIDVIVDKFGENIKINKLNDRDLIVTITVQVSPQFIGWLCSLGNKIKVIEPKEIIDSLEEYLKTILNQY